MKAKKPVGNRAPGFTRGKSAGKGATVQKVAGSPATVFKTRIGKPATDTASSGPAKAPASTPPSTSTRFPKPPSTRDGAPTLGSGPIPASRSGTPQSGAHSNSLTAPRIRSTAGIPKAPVPSNKGFGATNPGVHPTFGSNDAAVSHAMTQTAVKSPGSTGPAWKPAKPSSTGGAPYGAAVSAAAKAKSPSSKPPALGGGGADGVMTRR